MKAIEAWRELNATFRIAIVVALVLVGCGILRRALRPGPGSPPASSAEVQDTFQAVPETPSIPARAVVPAPAHRGPYRGRLTIAIEDTTRAPDGTAPAAPRQIEVLIPEDDTPIVMRATPGVRATVRYERIRKPWVAWAPGALLGASVGQSGRVSPHGGIVLVRAWRRLDLGAAVCREGIGPVIGWEAWREFTIVGQWTTLPFRGNSGPASLGICYRL